MSPAPFFPTRISPIPLRPSPAHASLQPYRSSPCLKTCVITATLPPPQPTRRANDCQTRAPQRPSASDSALPTPSSLMPSSRMQGVHIRAPLPVCLKSHESSKVAFSPQAHHEPFTATGSSVFPLIPWWSVKNEGKTGRREGRRRRKEERKGRNQANEAGSASTPTAPGLARTGSKRLLHVPPFNVRGTRRAPFSSPCADERGPKVNRPTRAVYAEPRHLHGLEKKSQAGRR